MVHSKQNVKHVDLINEKRQKMETGSVLCEREACFVNMSSVARMIGPMRKKMKKVFLHQQVGMFNGGYPRATIEDGNSKRTECNVHPRQGLNMWRTCIT